MTTKYDQIKNELLVQPHTWLITGVAGFIGSNLLEALLRLDQRVIGLDNFATGYQYNLDEVQSLVTAEQWTRFSFIKGDIRVLETCYAACKDVDFVLHQAALGSVPRSLDNPIATNETNISGFLNMLVAARDANVKSFVYAASSSTYGDHPALPKVEERIGNPLSPYAVTKYVNELYAKVFGRCYGLNTLGLRYFNVFGPRQNPHGAYAAVIPKWTASMLKGETIYINGTGETSRDFCFVANAIQANLLAATCTDAKAHNEVFNVALNDRTSLNQLFDLLHTTLLAQKSDLPAVSCLHRDFRPGDVMHSQADIGKAKQLLGYRPSHRIQDGIAQAMPWYIAHLAD